MAGQSKSFSIEQEFRDVLKLEGEALLDCSSRYQDPARVESLQRAIELLRSALDSGGKIVVTGVGKSGKVGQKIAATLSSTGSLAVFLHPTEGLHGDLGLARKGDVVLALSYTGNTDELARLIPSLKGIGIPVIGIGGNPKSRIAEQCTVWLDAHVDHEACPHNLAPTTSTTLAQAIGDALAVILMKVRGFNADAFARNHPGGSLGNRLHLTVREVMHTGSELPKLGPEAGMDEVISVSTRHKLGAVVICDGPRLLGLITDGDIRRALAHREKFFKFRASEVMTSDPVTAVPEMMAKDALELMENRSSQIGVLPVIESGDSSAGSKTVVGLVRLHDLLRSF